MIKNLNKRDSMEKTNIQLINFMKSIFLDVDLNIRKGRIFINNCLSWIASLIWFIFFSAEFNCMFGLQILSIILLATYPFMANLHGLELKILINMASVLKNMFAVSQKKNHLFYFHRHLASSIEKKGISDVNKHFQISSLVNLLKYINRWLIIQK